MLDCFYSVKSHPEWTDILKRQQTRFDGGLICENHFENEDKIAKRKDLRPGAVPFFDQNIEVAVEVDNDRISRIEILNDKTEVDSQSEIAVEVDGDEIVNVEMINESSRSNVQLINNLQLELTEMRNKIFHLDSNINDLATENEKLKSDIQLRDIKIEKLKTRFFDEETDGGKINAILEALKTEEYLSDEAADALKVSFTFV